MCILYKYSSSALSTWRQVGLFNDSELVPACPNCRECQKHANILLRVNTLPQLWALKPCWFGLAVYEQFPSKHKRPFLNYLFISFFSNPAFSKAPTASTIQASALPRRQTGHSRTRSKSRAKICHSICQSGRRGHNLLWLAAYLSRYSPALEERQKQEEAYAGSSYNTDLVVGWI